MLGKIKGIQIKGICASLPDNKIDNMEYSGLFGEAEIKKQIKVTGMRYRYMVRDKQTAVDLCLHSANALFEKTNCIKEEIAAVIYVSSCKRQPVPSTAFYIREKLSLGNNCVVFDVNLGCSAFVCGLTTMASLLNQNEAGKKGCCL